MLKLDKIFAIISNITAIATNKISKTSGKKAKTVSIAIEMAKNIISTKKSVTTIKIVKNLLNPLLFDHFCLLFLYLSMIFLFYERLFCHDLTQFFYHTRNFRFKSLDKFRYKFHIFSKNLPNFLADFTVIYIKNSAQKLGLRVHFALKLIKFTT